MLFPKRPQVSPSLKPCHCVIWLCSFSHQEVKSISLPLESGLALWLALANKKWQECHCVSSESGPLEILWTFLFENLFNHGTELMYLLDNERPSEPEPEQPGYPGQASEISKAHQQLRCSWLADCRCVGKSIRGQDHPAEPGPNHQCTVLGAQ